MRISEVKTKNNLNLDLKDLKIIKYSITAKLNNNIRIITILLLHAKVGIKAPMIKYLAKSIKG